MKGSTIAIIYGLAGAVGVLAWATPFGAVAAILLLSLGVYRAALKLHNLRAEQNALEAKLANGEITAQAYEEALKPIKDKRFLSLLLIMAGLLILGVATPYFLAMAGVIAFGLPVIIPLVAGFFLGFSAAVYAAQAKALPRAASQLARLTNDLSEIFIAIHTNAKFFEEWVTRVPLFREILLGVSAIFDLMTAVILWRTKGMKLRAARTAALGVLTTTFFALSIVMGATLTGGLFALGSIAVGLVRISFTIKDAKTDLNTLIQQREQDIQEKGFSDITEAQIKIARARIGASGVVLLTEVMVFTSILLHVFAVAGIMTAAAALWPMIALAASAVIIHLGVKLAEHKYSQKVQAKEQAEHPKEYRVEETDTVKDAIAATRNARLRQPDRIVPSTNGAEEKTMARLFGQTLVQPNIHDQIQVQGQGAEPIPPKDDDRDSSLHR